MVGILGKTAGSDIIIQMAKDGGNLIYGLLAGKPEKE